MILLASGSNRQGAFFLLVDSNRPVIKLYLMDDFRKIHQITAPKKVFRKTIS